LRVSDVIAYRNITRTSLQGGLAEKVAKKKALLDTIEKGWK